MSKHRSILRVFLASTAVLTAQAATPAVFNSQRVLGVHGALALADADLNGDGKVDLAVVSNDEVTIFLGSGNGAFSQSAHYTIQNTPNSFTPITVG